jgi:hypothetical protein
MGAGAKARKAASEQAFEAKNTLFAPRWSDSHDVTRSETA